MTTRAPLFSVCLVLLITLSASAGFAQSPAAADGAPYTPHKYSRSELIQFGTYDEPPIAFNWQVSDVRQKSQDNRLDFVITVDADMPTVVNFLEEGYRDQKPVARLVDDIMPFTPSRELLVVGHNTTSGTKRFTLSSTGMTRRFVLDIHPAGAQTELVLQNVVLSRLFSGLVPARAAFSPRSAQPVHLLYN